MGEMPSTVLGPDRAVSEAGFFHREPTWCGDATAIGAEEQARPAHGPPLGDRQMEPYREPIHPTVLRFCPSRLRIRLPPARRPRPATCSTPPAAPPQPPSRRSSCSRAAGRGGRCPSGGGQAKGESNRQAFATRGKKQVESHRQKDEAADRNPKRRVALPTDPSGSVHQRSIGRAGSMAWLGAGRHGRWNTFRWADEALRQGVLTYPDLGQRRVRPTKRCSGRHVDVNVQLLTADKRGEYLERV